VFVMNYIRSYASAVGLSADDAVNRFQEIPGAPQPEAFDPAALELARRERAVSALWVTIASGVVLLMALAFQAVHELVLRFANR
jgi:cytoskeletal protein RodZ